PPARPARPRCGWCRPAGMPPAAPWVGPVTPRPPAAFCSLPASAYSVTHSIAYSGSVTSDVCSSLSSSLRARLRTLSPPGSTPSASQPAATHSCMTDQIRSRPDLTAASSVPTRGDDPPEPPAVPARGADPPEPRAVPARGDDPPEPPAGRTSSLASMTPLIGRPLSRVRVSSSAPLANG